MTDEENSVTVTIEGEKGVVPRGLPAEIVINFPGKFTSSSFDPPDSIEIEEWLDLGGKINIAGEAVQWWVGDWLNFGERKYGELYAQGTGDNERMSHHKQMQLKRVALRVDPVTRRPPDVLSWSHHREVAPLEREEQEHWLGLAEKSGWSVAELHEAMRKKGHRDPSEKDGPVKDICPICQKNEGTVKVCAPCFAHFEVEDNKKPRKAKAKKKRERSKKKK